MPGSVSDSTGTAKLLVLVLAFAWGFNWIAGAIALREVSPWTLRFAGAGIGTLTLFAAALAVRPQHEGAAVASISTSWLPGS